MPRYYPEAIVINKDGKEISRISPVSKKNDYGMCYYEDIRDPVLKINDDRKIIIQLNGIKEPGTLILLTIKEYDMTGKGAIDADYERAWFRLFNEETN